MSTAADSIYSQLQEALFATTANRWKRRANIQADKRTQEEKSKAYSLLMMQVYITFSYMLQQSGHFTLCWLHVVQIMCCLML